MKKIITAFLLFLVLALSGCIKNIESKDPQITSSSNESSQLEDKCSDIKMYRFSREWTDKKSIDGMNCCKYCINQYIYIGDNRAIAVIGANDSNGSSTYGGVIVNFEEKKYLNNIEILKTEEVPKGFWLDNTFLYSPRIYDDNHFIMRSYQHGDMKDIKVSYLFYNKDGKADKVISYKENDKYDEKIMNILKQFTFGGALSYYESNGDIKEIRDENEKEKYPFGKVVFDGTAGLFKLPCIKYSLFMFDNENIFVTKKTITELYERKIKSRYQEYLRYKEYSNEFCLYNINDKNVKFSKKYPYDPIYAMGNKIIFTNRDKTELYYAELDADTVIKVPKLFYSSEAYNYFDFSPDNKYIAAVKTSTVETEDSEQIINEVTISVFDTVDFKCVSQETIKVDENEKLLFDIDRGYNLNVFPNGTVAFGLGNDDYIYTFLLENS